MGSAVGKELGHALDVITMLGKISVAVEFLGVHLDQYGQVVGRDRIFDLTLAL